MRKGAWLAYDGGMKLRVLLPLLGALTLAAPACSVHSLLNQLEDESAKTGEIVCECTNVFPDTAACEAMFESYFSQVDRDCMEDALAVDKAASKETLKCSLDVSKRYNDCIKDNLDCNDPNSFQPCQSILEDQDGCPELPEAVQTELNMCGGG